MICMQSWKKSWSWVQKVEIKLNDCKVANAQKKKNSGQVNGKEQRFYSELEEEW